MPHSRLVRLTETHLPGSRDPEGELLCDADLAILASDSADYAAYVAAVRQEYAQVPEEEFLAGRLTEEPQSALGGRATPTALVTYTRRLFMDLDPSGRIPRSR